MHQQKGSSEGPHPYA